VRFCDGGLLDKVVSEANLPEVWRIALKEQTNHTRDFLNTLANAGGRAGGRQISALERELVDLPIEEARLRVQAAITVGDLSLATTRSVEDVTDRLVTRAKRAIAPRLEGPVCDLLHALATFQQTTTPQACLDKVVSLARGLGVNLDAWKTQWLARLEAIQAQADDALAHCRFDALGEEAFDYYDGMAFDIADNDDFTHPVATGGRYDLLVGKISGGLRNARAVGCVIRPDRFGPDENGQGG
jgi:ATP phosphoribosyltransferase regulatory subunit